MGFTKGIWLWVARTVLTLDYAFFRAFFIKKAPLRGLLFVSSNIIFGPHIHYFLSIDIVGVLFLLLTNGHLAFETWPFLKEAYAWGIHLSSLILLNFKSLTTHEKFLLDDDGVEIIDFEHDEVEEWDHDGKAGDN